MIARVMAAFLFSHRDSLTAAELAVQLGASAGSISAVLKMLRTVALIEPAPVPGSRRDHYRIRDDAWATLMTSQDAMVTMMGDIAEAGLAAVPTGSPARRRLEQMQDFYAYLLREMPALIERWHAAR